MAKLHINLGDAPNDRTGDPLRTAFEKVNSNFDELYARTGDDIQIPALAGNTGKVLTTNGTALSWEDGLSVTDFGEGFSLTSSDKIVTNKLYSTNQTNSNQHYRLELNTNGVIILPDQSIINGSYMRAIHGSYAGLAAGPDLEHNEDSWMWVDGSGAWIATDYSDNAYTWAFGNNGRLQLPGTGAIVNPRVSGLSFTATTVTGISGDTKEFAVGGDADTLTTSWTATGGGIVGTASITNVNIGLSFTFVTFNQSFTATGPITFSSGADGSTLELSPDGSTTWTLGSDGTLTLPNGSIQTSTGSINCQPEVDTVVFTSSQEGIQTIKLLLQVEGTVTTGDADTQSCEMIVAKGFRGPTVAASVYGIVYTCV